MKKPQEIIKTLVKSGLTQEKISHHTGIPQPTISRIITSKNPNPRWQTVEALYSFLETIDNFDDENI